jgi:UDP-N-acetylmuramoyl-tripeptide--D-alanyl-D-alanine ligase
MANDQHHPASPWRPGSEPDPFRNNPILRARAGTVLSAAAALWRRLLFRTRVVAITGSYGKSTAVKLLAAILESKHQVNWLGTPNNGRLAGAQCLLAARPRHRFTVLELGTRKPGTLARSARHVRPDIAAVLAVGLQHTNEFPDLDAMAREKAALLSGIRGRRIAVLNGSDPRVKAMAETCRGRVILFGRSPEFDLWASDIDSTWPALLSFTAHAGGQSVRIQTRLAGDHWLDAVLGAIACAMACGMTLPECAEPLMHVEPVTGRMSIHPLPSGATVIRDDHNASMSSLGPALDVLKRASATRRIVIMGDVFDSPLNQTARLELLGLLAAESSDVAAFVGNKHMKVAVRAAKAAGMAEGSAIAFNSLPEAAEWLRSELRQGDLALIRARGQFHMERLYFAQLGAIRCWMDRCSFVRSCDSCHHLGFAPGPPAQDKEAAL